MARNLLVTFDNGPTWWGFSWKAKDSDTMTSVVCESSCAPQESAMDTHVIILTVSGMGGENYASQRGQEHSPRPHG